MIFRNGRKMKTKKCLARIAVLAIMTTGFLVGGMGIASADSTLFMKIDNLQGESQATGRNGQTELSSFTFGATTSSPSLGQGASSAGKPSFAPVTVTKVFDSISLDTLKTLSSGKRYSSIVIEMTKQLPIGRQTWARYSFTDSFITADAVSSDENGQLIETLTFVPKTFKVDYYKTDNAGKLGAPLSFGFDVSLMRVL